MTLSGQDRPVRLSRCLLLLALILPAATVAAERARNGVVHTVYLWLQQPGHAQHRDQLLRATDRLRDIPGVLDIKFGEVISSDRDIVDDSFDVGIYFYFQDIEAMNAYLLHPVHQRTVREDISPLVKRILVHDFADVNPLR